MCYKFFFIKIMYLNSLMFMFLILLIVNSILTIMSKNSVHSVLFLVLNFLVSFGLLIILERDFLALVFLIIYVGAISILFLFVVMMLDLKIINSNKDLLKYFPIGIIVSILFLSEVCYYVKISFCSNSYNVNYLTNDYTNWYLNINILNDISAIGQVLYTHYVVQFLISGLILLLAVIAAIVLTKHNLIEQPKKQILFKQLSRSYKNVL